MPGAVTKKHIRFNGLAIAQSYRSTGKLRRRNLGIFVQANQKFFPGNAAQSQSWARYPLILSAPRFQKITFKVAINHIDTDGQALKNSPKDLWVFAS